MFDARKRRAREMLTGAGSGLRARRGDARGMGSFLFRPAGSDGGRLGLTIAAVERFAANPSPPPHNRNIGGNGRTVIMEFSNAIHFFA